MRNQAIVITIFLLIHHMIAVMHGDAHTNIPVILSSWQNIFVYSVIVLVPIIAVALVWTRYATIGLSLLLICMAGSLVFDVYHHYILVSPDNIAHLPPSSPDFHSRFIWTAHALTLLQIVGVVLAAYFLRSNARERRIV